MYVSVSILAHLSVSNSRQSSVECLWEPRERPEVHPRPPLGIVIQRARLAASRLYGSISRGSSHSFRLTIISTLVCAITVG